MFHLPRLITAMATPFTEDSSVDYQGAQELALRLIDEGSEGLVISGTTGESPTLTIQEKINLFRLVKEAVGSRGVVIAGTGTNSTADCLRLTDEACKCGVDAVMVVVPYYNKPNQEGLYLHFKAAAETSSRPVILYNVPGRTGINMLPETVAKLAEIPNIAALKEAAGSLDQVSALKGMLPEEFLIFSGDDSLTLPMMAVGAYGVISVASNVASALIKEMIDAFVQGDVAKAGQIHGRLFPLFRNMFITANPIPVKKALNLMGRPAGGLRLPLVEASPAETKVIKDSMEKLSLI